MHVLYDLHDFSWAVIIKMKTQIQPKLLLLIVLLSYKFCYRLLMLVKHAFLSLNIKLQGPFSAFFSEQVSAQY